MLSMDVTSRVASNFLVHYYNEFTMPNRVASMIDLYDDQSYVVTVDLGQEAPTVAHGRTEIAMRLARLDASLGQRKAEVITADHVPLSEGAIQVICQGIMYLRRSRRVFLHAFVLAPTAYRMNTYHIVSDYLRFVNAEEEVVPEGAIILTPDQVANFVAEESRRAEEQRQRQQLLEFQQRLRAQNSAKAQQAGAAVAPAVAAPAAEEQKIAIPTPASRQRQQQQQQQVARPAAAQAAAAAPSDAAPAATTATAAVEGRARGGRNTEGRGRGRGGEEGRGRGRGGEEGRGRGRGGEEGRGRGRGSAEGRGRGGNNSKTTRDAPAAAAASAPSGAVAGSSNQAPAQESRGGRGGRAERPPRNERKPAAAAAAAEGQQKQDGAATADKANGEKTERKPRGAAKTGPTEFIRLTFVPKTVKLSEIKEEMAKAGKEPQDAYWFGRDSSHAVVKLKSTDAAETAVKVGKVKILTHEVNVVAFYP